MRIFEGFMSNYFQLEQSEVTGYSFQVTAFEFDFDHFNFLVENYFPCLIAFVFSVYVFLSFFFLFFHGF